MSDECKTCQPIGEYYDDLARYSLQSEIYLYILTCPPGAYCGGTTVIYFVLCDGDILRVEVPDDTSDAVRQQIINAMIQEGLRREPFCVDTDDNGGGGGGGGGGSTTPPYNPPIRRLYYNTIQQCNSRCPNGQNFIAYIQAGTVAAYSQAAADRYARTLACQIASQGRLCLNGFDVDCCSDEAFSQSLTVTGPGVRLMQQWSITGGTLPAGLTLNGGWRNGASTTITGTPTVPGLYDFVVRVLSQTGLYQEANCRICVVGMSPTTLPDGTENDPYSQTLTATGCANPPLSWQITAGALPAGLTLNENTGVISGTPTEDGDFNFTVTLQTEAT